MSINTYLRIKCADTYGRSQRAGTAAMLGNMLAKHYGVDKPINDMYAPIGKAITSDDASINTLRKGPGVIAHDAGSIIGALGGYGDLDSAVAADKRTLEDYAPGVAAYKMQKQKRTIEKLFNKGKGKGNKTLSETLGKHTSTLFAKLLGGAYGRHVYKKAPEYGKQRGERAAGQYADLFNLGGHVLGNIRGKRNKEQLSKYYNSGILTDLKNYLLPGVGNYNDWRNSFSSDKILKEYRKDPEKLYKAIDALNPEELEPEIPDTQNMPTLQDIGLDEPQETEE